MAENEKEGWCCCCCCDDSMDKYASESDSDIIEIKTAIEDKQNKTDLSPEKILEK